MAQTLPNLYRKLFVVKKGRPSLCPALDNLKAIYGIIYVAVLVCLAFTMPKNMAREICLQNFHPTKRVFGGSSQNTLWYFYRLMDSSQC